MLNVYAKEFVAIGSFLRKRDGLRKGYILVDKKKLEDMLNKNRYDTAAHKLKVWKALKWIDTEADGRVTKRIYDNGVYRPFVKMDAAVLEQLESLQKS